MPGKLEKQIDKALADTERWLKRQPSWKNGNLRSAKGTQTGPRGPAVLSESDCVLQFARFLNKYGVAWRDIHIEVKPSQWLVDPRGGVGTRPRKISLAIVDRDRLARRKTPFAPAKDQDFLFDAIFEFKLAGNGWVRTLKNGTPARPPRRVAAAVERETKKMRTNLRDLWAKSGYIVVVEEADHELPAPPAPIDGLHVAYLKTY